MTRGDATRPTAPAGAPAPAPSVAVPVHGLPDPPPASLDPYLDAAVRCFVRFGVSRTSVQDVAAELKVNRTTVYRQVGNIDAVLGLVNARAVNRIVKEAFRRAGRAPLSPESVADLLAQLIEMIRADPVVTKVLADEMDLIGTLVADLPAMIARVVGAVTPALEEAMASGRLARRSAAAIAEWLTRVGATCIVAPPPGDLRAFLAEVVVPVLGGPAGPGSSRKASPIV